jgi:uncharacterized membrane protein YfcA
MDSFLALYFGLGLVPAFVAGLLGVGGGLLMVPALSWAFAAAGLSRRNTTSIWRWPPRWR